MEIKLEKSPGKTLYAAPRFALLIVNWQQRFSSIDCLIADGENFEALSSGKSLKTIGKSTIYHIEAGTWPNWAGLSRRLGE